MNIEEHKTHHNQLGLPLDFTTYLLRDGSLPLTGNLDMGTNAITNVGLVDGVDVSAFKTLYDAHIADSTIHFTVASIDHGLITGLSDNDHPQYLRVVDIDDTPVNGELAQPISSNWAFDHVAASDPHTGYALLLGRSGGQTLIGGTASGNDLTLQSTSHGTKGHILFGTSGYDEVNNRLGIGIAVPTQALDVVGQGLFTATNDVAGNFRNTGTDTNTVGSAIRVHRRTTANMVDGFGTRQLFSIEDSAAVVNNIAAIHAVRAGADNTGDLILSTSSAGSLSSKLWIKGNGNVGVGADPGTLALFYVGGTAHFQTNTNADPLQISRNGSDTTQMTQIGVDDTYTIFHTIQDEAAAGMQFRFETQTSPTDRSIYMTSDATSIRFGVGNECLSGGIAEFHGANQYVLVNSSTDTEHGFAVQAGPGTGSKAFLYMSGGNVNHAGHLQLVDGTSAAAFATIDMRTAGGTIRNYLNTSGDSWLNGGDVGIGHTGPSICLDVRRNQVSNYVFGVLNSNTTAGSGSIGMYVQCGNSHAQGAGTTGDNRWIEFWSQSNHMSNLQYTTASPYAQFAAASDERLKKNIVPTRLDGLNIINQIELVEFDWVETDVHQEIGYIAQQVQNVYSPMVSAAKRSKVPPTERSAAIKRGDSMDLIEEDCLFVGDSVLVPILVKAVQQLYAELLDTKGRLDKLEKK